MALTTFTTDVENIQALSDTPNETEGLTADQLKKKFDDAGIDIKSFINDTLIDELDTKIASIDAKQVARSAFRSTMSTNTSTANTTLISFDTSVYDIGSDYDTTNKKFTAPYNGIYLFNAQIAVLSPVDQERYGFVIRKNGTTTEKGFRFQSSGTGTLYASMTAIVRLSADDYVDIVSSFDTTKTIDSTASITYFEGSLLYEE